LRQPELLTRTSPTELTRSYAERWSEPLETMLPRVLADDVAAALHAPSVRLYPWYANDRPDWQIEIDLLRFEPDEHGEVLLVARWRMHELGGSHRSSEDGAELTLKSASTDPADRAQALSTAISELADAVARALCTLASRK